LFTVGRWGRECKCGVEVPLHSGAKWIGLCRHFKLLKYYIKKRVNDLMLNKIREYYNCLIKLYTSVHLYLFWAHFIVETYA
jgi:hypothetical protein